MQKVVGSNPISQWVSGEQSAARASQMVRLLGALSLVRPGEHSLTGLAVS
jgi:hypothetical protein